MNNVPKPYDLIYHYDLPEIALFESRRFERDTQQNYVYVRKSFLKRRFKEKYQEVNNKFSPILPVSSDENLFENFIELDFCKFVLGEANYITLLSELLEMCTTYDEVNILFIYLRDQEKFTEESINKIVSLGITSRTVRNSFTAQKYMIDLIYNNKHLIEKGIYHSILSEFPHASRKSGGLFKLESSKRLP
jgi:hypothetical protein